MPAYRRVQSPHCSGSPCCRGEREVGERPSPVGDHGAPGLGFRRRLRPLRGVRHPGSPVRRLHHARWLRRHWFCHRHPFRHAFRDRPPLRQPPGQNAGSYDTAHPAPYDATGSYDTTGTYDTAHTTHTTQWSTGTHEAAAYDTYGTQQQGAYDTGAYDTGAYDTGAYDASAWAGEYQPLPVVPAQATAPDVSGQWDATAWLQPDQSGNPADRTQQWAWDTQSFDTGALDATQWNADATPQQHPQHADHPQDSHHPQETQPQDTAPPLGDEPADTGELPAVTGPLLLDGQEEITPSGTSSDTSYAAGTADLPAAPRSPAPPLPPPSARQAFGVADHCRAVGVRDGRRRIAAASVGGLGGEESSDAAASVPDAPPVKPSAANNKLDTQLASLSAGASDFADRASRTQERIDLKAQQEAEKRRAAEEAARKERLRPKFALPVAQHGLSAYYGQSGINWMSVHSGIDFPVSYGTPVMAATDGTVRTQYNSAYGNMMIVTAKDGTETWYCHLSSYRVPSGTTVKAGDPIAYSGNSGNSTGPHLHFEVRPAGGSAIDPLSWLRSHGLDPT